MRWSGRTGVAGRLRYWCVGRVVCEGKWETDNGGEGVEARSMGRFSDKSCVHSC